MPVTIPVGLWWLSWNHVTSRQAGVPASKPLCSNKVMTGILMKRTVFLYVSVKDKDLLGLQCGSFQSMEVDPITSRPAIRHHGGSV